MRTWDYKGFAVGPVLALLEHIFNPKIWDFVMKMIFLDVTTDINKKGQGKLSLTYLTCFL